MSLVDNLESNLGTKGWVPTADSLSRRRDWLDKFGEMPLGVARPSSTAEVACALDLCTDARIPVVPQKGNTSLSGAAVLTHECGIILSLSRMITVGAVDMASGTIAVEAGVVLSRIHQVLEGSGLMFPMHIGSEGTAQIGGPIGTNAGGSHAFRYGMMQDLVFGLEVVFPDGAVWDGMRRVQKDNAGYQPRKLFCGAEGTLGVVTRAVLSLAPEPITQVTALLAVPDMATAIELSSICRKTAGEFLTGLEFFAETGLEMAQKNIPDLAFPFQKKAPFYLLVEAGTSSSLVPLEDILAEVLEDGMNSGMVIDAVLAKSKAQRNALWRIREEQPEGQRREGAQLKHDMSVPPHLLADFLERANGECRALPDGVRINAFGHLGDGNVHFNLSPPLGQDGFSGLEDEFAHRLGLLANEMHGSLAAEHGLGRARVALADQLRDPLERRLMVDLKAVFDATGNLNPGVIVAAPK